MIYWQFMGLAFEQKGGTLFAHHMPRLARNRIATAGTETPLHETAKLLAAEQINLVVICDAEGRVAGIINVSDVVHAVCSCRIGYHHACELNSDAVMSRDVVSCRTGDPLSNVLTVMKDTRPRHIPIVDKEGQPIGILYARDVLDQLHCGLQLEDKSLVDYFFSAGYR